LDLFSDEKTSALINGEIIMTLEQIADVIGWMLLINIVLLAIGFLKITVFKSFVKSVLDSLMDNQADNIYSVIPRALINFEILIIVFNLTPYLALRIMLGWG
jgi:hypothetical protein